MHPIFTLVTTKNATNRMDMDNKIQEITQQLYREGIEKAEIEAAQILQLAQEQATAIVQQAEEGKQRLLAQAQLQATELTKRTHAELRLVINQALQKLRQNISQLIRQQALDVPLTHALQDPQALVGLLDTVINHLYLNEQGQLHIQLNAAQEDTIRTYLNGKIGETLEKEPFIKPDDSINAGFKIGRVGENYVISFTDDDFTAYISQFMHPEIAKIYQDHE